ncbi:MAG: hypothetical protein QXQ37_00715 [Nitrososphaerota archaeon]
MSLTQFTENLLNYLSDVGRIKLGPRQNEAPPIICVNIDGSASRIGATSQIVYNYRVIFDIYAVSRRQADEISILIIRKFLKDWATLLDNYGWDVHSFGRIMDLEQEQGIVHRVLECEIRVIG